MQDKDTKRSGTMNGIISYIHTGTVACRQLSTSNNYGGKIQLPERKAGLSDRQFKDICQAVLNKPLNKYVSFIINYYFCHFR
ncbi:hypothetical protein EAJ15_12495 [Parabacteroides merdae]|nr:hypothetical protein EAJ15_12495 [Parabacteroides merdae]